MAIGNDPEPVHGVSRPVLFLTYVYVSYRSLNIYRTMYHNPGKTARFYENTFLITVHIIVS